jgi:DNA-binding response OmpR family regulator
MKEKGQRSITILVIDDDDRVRTLLRDILVLAGHRVIEARDGRCGLEQLETNGFDIVFTDLGMPGTSGWEVAKCVKQKTPLTPVVLITGWGRELDESMIQESGVDLVIGKPFQIKDIIGIVERFSKKNPDSQPSIAPCRFETGKQLT